MAIISLMEVFDAIIMTVVLGLIFMRLFKKQVHGDVLDTLTKRTRFSWHDFLFSISVIAPAIVLHEMAHKFIALSLGMNAVFHAHYTFLGLGLLLALINFSFIFVVPGYVSISGIGTPLEFSLIAFAGPFMHLLLWLGSWAYLKYGKVKKKQVYFLFLTKRINMFLFILNMLPIPGIDGFSFFYNLIKAIF